VFQRLRLLCIFLVLVFALTASNAPGQMGNLERRPLDEPRFNIDMAAFKADDEDNVKLEIYYKVYNDGLKFFKKGDQFVANYELNVVVLGEEDRQITGSSVERFYRLSSYRETRNPNDFLINLLGLKVGKGKYKVVVKLIDKNSGKIASREEEIEIGSLFKKDIDMSQIEFIREVIPVDSIPSRFDKGEKRIIPAVTRRFGEEIKQISFYVEIYSEKEEKTDAVLEYEIQNSQDEIVYEDNFDLTLENPLIRFIKHIPLEDFLPGDYRVRLRLSESSGRPLVERKSVFNIAWSLSALIKNDYEAAVNMLKYVGRENELDELRDAPEGERKQAFLDFWKKHDPTPNTPENELMEKYYGRIRNANQMFSTIHKDGWKTDMGMVYIIYGEPDHVETHPFELEQKPYQVWYYYALSRTFGFVDELGTGDYRLQFPYDGRRGFINDRIDDYD